MFVNFNILNQLGSPAINSNTFANRPAAGQTGRLFVSTDTFEIYRDNGTTWDLIGGPGSSTITGTGTATQVAYFTSSQAIGSSANLYWDNTNTRLGIGTSTPGVRLDIHGTGIMQHINATSATANSLMAFQRTGTNVWRLGDQYNGGSNFFELHNTTLVSNAIQIAAATNKSILTSLETYSTGVARGNLLDYTLSLPNGTTFTSPNTVTALGATLNLNIAGSATIPAGARSGADFFNGINFTSAGTFTVNQASTIRAFSNVTAGWAFNGSAVGTVTHLAGLRVLFPTNSGSAINVTDNYALLINNQNANTGTITYTNRWGIYQEGASDLNYMAANLLLGSTVNNGNRLQVTGNGNLTGDMTADAYYLNGMTAGNGALYWTSDRVTLANYNSNGVLHFEVNGGAFAAMFDASGNLGLGQAPNSTWIANSKAIQIKDWTSLSQRTDGAAVFGMNIVETSSNSYSYLQSFSAGRYQINGNEHTWHTAPSGTAGNAITFTQAMMLNSSGNLLLGTTTGLSSGRQEIVAQSSNGALLSLGVPGTSDSFQLVCDSGPNALIINKSNTPMIFYTNNTRRVDITAGGNFLIGTTTDNGSKLRVAGNTYFDGKADIGLVNILTDSISSAVTASCRVRTAVEMRGYEVTMSALSPTSGSITIPKMYGLITNQPNVQLNVTVTDSYGLYVGRTDDPFSGGVVTNKYGIIVDNNAGPVGIGVVSPVEKLEVNGAIKTAAPTTGTAAAWKLGSYKAAAVVVSTTNYIEVDIGGTLYKLAVVT